MKTNSDSTQDLESIQPTKIFEKRLSVPYQNSPFPQPPISSKYIFTENINSLHPFSTTDYGPIDFNIHADGNSLFAVFKIPAKKIRQFECSYLIAEVLVFYKGTYYTQDSSLIDEDYSSDFMCLFEAVGHSSISPSDATTEGFIKLMIIEFPKHNFNNRVYRGHIFSSDPENDDPQISGFCLNSLTTNGIDVVLSKSYIIQPKGTIAIRLPFIEQYEWNAEPNLFVLRSRFARQGLRIQTRQNYNEIIIINESRNIIDLGNTIFQIVLPHSCQSSYLKPIYLQEIDKEKRVPTKIVNNYKRKEKESRF